MAKKNKQDMDKVEEQSLIISDRESESQKLVQITAQIREDQLLALEILQTAEQQKRGEFYDASNLIQEAIDLLIKKHMIAIRLKK
jgi:hypothetical protein